MATFVNQEISPHGTETKIFLGQYGVFIYDGVGKPKLRPFHPREYEFLTQDVPFDSDQIIALMPDTRESANQMSVALRLGAKRLEELAKTLPEFPRE